MEEGEGRGGAKNCRGHRTSLGPAGPAEMLQSIETTSKTAPTDLRSSLGHEKTFKVVS